MSAHSAVEVAGLVKKFRHRPRWFQSRQVVALDGITFSVDEGQGFGLLGPNGSGKTTLLRILSTVLLPTSGEARVAGRPVSQVDPVKRLIGVVPPDAKGFRGFLSGRENLEFFSVLQRLKPSRIRPRIEHLLGRLGIAGLDRQPVWSYSTGQRQRLNIARALLHDPPILLLDEPTRGLDPWSAEGIRRWIRQEMILGESKTVLVASNQREEIRELCDQAVLLRQGRLFWEGPVAGDGELDGAFRRMAEAG